jgi:hypothetical protein
LKRVHIPGLMNVFQVTDPKEIKALSDDPVVDRQFETRTCPLNWFLLKRSLSVLSYRRRRFPTMSPHHCKARERYQGDLWRKLSSDAADIRTGPVELASIATWVRGVGSDEEVGILTQQLLGRLFKTDFTATAESWDAARVLVAAPRSPNLPKVLWWFITGKVGRAKRLLAGNMDEDLSAVNAIGIAVHNVVKGLRHMRVLYADMGVRNAYSRRSVSIDKRQVPARLETVPFRRTPFLSSTLEWQVKCRTATPLCSWRRVGAGAPRHCGFRLCSKAFGNGRPPRREISI